MTFGALMACGPLALLAVLGAVAIFARRLHRDRLALRYRDAEIEQLHDRIWRLAESGERYRALVEAEMAFVVQRDATGRVSFADEGYARLVGRPAADLVGTFEHLPAAAAGTEQALPGGGRAGEIAVRLQGVEAPRWYAWVEMPVMGRDGTTEFLRAGRDVTERVEAARTLGEARGRAEAASVAKSRFLATVSHEFRTPLNGILGMAALLRDTTLTPEQRTYLGAVRTSGEALLSLIDEILDFSKIEAGRLDLAAEPFDLAALVEGAVELLAPRAQDKGIEIAVSLAPDLPCRLIGDADRLRQILMNLAGNAIKFTAEGGVGVEVTREPGGGAGGGIAIAIRDTGPGIPPERLPALFEEFEQGDGSASRQHEGTGLGLAITRRIVEGMGGVLGAESEPGVGSVFRAALPIPTEPGSAAIGAERTRMPGRRVLVVAASPFEARYALDRLHEAGAFARQAPTLEAGLAALRERPAYDVVLADRALGDAAVRALAQAARAVGVRRSLVLLAPFDRRDFGPPADAGFDGYLVKPIRAASLAAHLDEVESLPRSVCAIAAPRPVLPPQAVPVQTVSGPARGRHVLLAEDNEINALLARTALARLGATVEWARDGREALALATDPTRAFDLALLDVRMPGLDGLEVARRVRRAETGSGHARLTMVALTANVLEEDESAARAAGFDAFLAKPLDLGRLAALIHSRAAA